MTLINLLLITASFSDANLPNGDYQWLRLNNRGLEHTDCLKKKESIQKIMDTPSGPDDVTGTFTIENETMVSTRQRKGCAIKETLKARQVSNELVTFKLEDVEVSGCTSIDQVRQVNIERPYDDENLNFLHTTFKIVQVVRDDDIVVFIRDEFQCFYARKK